MTETKQFIENSVWTLTDNFRSETGGFSMASGDWFEMMTLFGVENFTKSATERAKELGKDLVITVAQVGSQIYVNWKPKPKAADGR